MKIPDNFLLVFDTEASGAQRNHANPFDPRNKMMSLSYIVYDLDTKRWETINENIEYHSSEPYLDKFARFQELVDKARTVAGFNIKFDMNWTAMYGIDWTKAKVWDAQLFHYILLNQTIRLPSLNGVAEYYELPEKLDVVKSQYWEKGLDTDQVPWDILIKYGEWDVWLTLQVVLRQFRDFKKFNEKLQATTKLRMLDINQLHLMEYNGFKYDKELSNANASEAESRMSSITQELNDLADVADYSINWGSTEQISAVLFGGAIKRIGTEEYLFHYKPDKKGRAKDPVLKTRKIEIFHELPRLVEPVAGTELAKDGFWSTNEDSLKKIKTRSKSTKRIIELLLDLAKIEKLHSQYFTGMPKIMEEMNWGDFLHPQLMQSITKTGRLASSKPNGQNISKENKNCWVSRYG